MAAASVANADDAEPPIEAVLLLEFQHDATFGSDDPALEINEAAPTIEAEITARPAPMLSVHSHVIGELVRDSNPFEDTFFDDVGVYVETLQVEYGTQSFGVRAGKFSPPFGVGWDLLPGLYGSDFADDYELTEQIGFGARATLDGGDFGTHALGASAFFADTSVLSDSALTSRGRLRRSDGGPANTGDPASFALTLDGIDLAGISGLGYHAAISRQRPGEGDTATERGYALAFYGYVPLGEGWIVLPTIEFAAQENDDAGPDDAYYVNAGLEAVQGPWSASLAGGTRVIAEAGGGTTTDKLVQVSVGYEFDDGPVFELGYKFSEESGIASHVLGALVGYELEF